MADNIIDIDDRRGFRDRIRLAKWAYSTRRVVRDEAWTLTTQKQCPQPGDLALTTITRIGHHKRLELRDGRRAHLFAGEDVVVVYGNRYAPDQFEAIIPDQLVPCHLVAAGGIASQMVFKHDAVRNPTQLTPVGLISDTSGRIVNLRDFALPPMAMIDRRPPVIAVAGSSMNAGKTTAAAGLIRGLTLAGLRVNAGKATGTGAGCDIWHFKDAGAKRVMDFLDTGHPSTYLLPPSQVKRNFLTLLSHLSEAGTDIIVIEIADGLYQSETAALIASNTFARHVDAVVFAALDPLSGVHGVARLRSWGVKTVAVSGVVTRSPLSMRELQDAIDLPILGREVLQSPIIDEYAREWLGHPAASRATEGGRQ